MNAENMKKQRLANVWFVIENEFRWLHDAFVSSHVYFFVFTIYSTAFKRLNAAFRLHSPFIRLIEVFFSATLSLLSFVGILKSCYKTFIDLICGYSF